MRLHRAVSPFFAIDPILFVNQRKEGACLLTNLVRWFAEGGVHALISGRVQTGTTVLL